MTATNRLQLAVAAYLDHLQKNWREYQNGHVKAGPTYPALEFDLDFGRKYLRIWTHYSYTPGVKGQRSCHSFIVLKPTKASKSNPIAFVEGAILKCATWQQPATNFARGSIYSPASYAHHQWTGAS